MMYKSPIEIFTDEMRLCYDNNIVEAVQRYDIQVDKDELLKALRYDRQQYEKGFADGKIAGYNNIVRCKDCLHAKFNDYEGVYECGKLRLFVNGEFYCFYGIRRPKDD